MSALVIDRPGRASAGGRHARRAVIRWAWRLFRREWRQQALIVCLLIVAIAATIVGLGAASNTSELKADPTFGTATTLISLPGTDAQLSADIAAIESAGPVDVIAHQHVPIPGSVATVDVRAESPQAVYGGVTLRLDSGRYPTGAGEVAVTGDVAQEFGLRVGSTWHASGRAHRVVGIVENPIDLTDQFALVPPGGADPPSEVTILTDAGQQTLQGVRLPSGTGLNMGSRGTTPKGAVAALVLALGTLGLVFVGLLAVAGFTVMAQRRLRALGMFRSLGATDRHIRLVMLANGAAVGTTAAVVGTAVGLALWWAFVPFLQSTAGHRVDPFAMPWWAVVAAMVLTVLTAIGAAWWPARAAARIPVVAALSGRPPRPQPTHRFAALGVLLLGGGLTLLALANPGTDQHRPAFIIAGTVATPIGVLLLAPLAIRVLAAAGRRAPISVRLALRDLVRYQARSGAALGAVTLAVGVAATIAISASATRTPAIQGNLPANQLVLHISPPGPGTQIPPLPSAQLQALSQRVADLGAALHASAIVPLEQAYNPLATVQPASPGPDRPQPAGHLTVELDKVTLRGGTGIEVTGFHILYVATPAVLGRDGITPAQIDPTADVVTGRSDLGGLRFFAPDLGVGEQGSEQRPGVRRSLPGPAQPTIQTLRHLSTYPSGPSTLITPHAMEALGLQVITAGWLIQAGGPLTRAQITTVTRAAASAGLYVETRTTKKSMAPLRDWSTAAGGLVALGVLAMTVGLIRSETTNELRTLAATGASSVTRRTLTGATSGALGLLGALLGTAGAYAALLAWHRSNLSPLRQVPVVNLVAIVAGLPAIAFIAGWMLTGPEPAAMARRALD